MSASHTIISHFRFYNREILDQISRITNHYAFWFSLSLEQAQKVQIPWSHRPLYVIPFFLPLPLLQICFAGYSPTFHDDLPPHFQGPINRWSSGNSMIQHPNTRKGAIMAHQFSHSRKWKRQHVHSVTRIFSGKEDLAVYTEELCAQER
jgi:hypothetical protein